MTCPFPGMDPYLEDPDLWPDFHLGLIAAIRHCLQPLLIPRYYAHAGQRVYLERAPARGYYPDLTLQRRPEAAGGRGTASTLVADEPLLVELSGLREPYLEIRAAGSHEVVAVLEVLSPANKTPGRGREEYLRKREEVMASHAHLVEVDLLRGGSLWGESWPGVRFPESATDYQVLVSRAGRREQAEVYRFRVRDRLPRVSVPLREPDADVVLDLPAAFALAYAEGAYALRVDYAAPPRAPLRGEDAAWAEALLRQAGLRPPAAPPL